MREVVMISACQQDGAGPYLSALVAGITQGFMDNCCSNVKPRKTEEQAVPRYTSPAERKKKREKTDMRQTAGYCWAVQLGHPLL